MVLENTTGRMSDCLRLLNGNYGMYYRKLVGGKGYVFHDRFKSTLIENDAYLLQSVVYLLRNPLSAGIVNRAANYIWSSGSYYFKATKYGDFMGSNDFIKSALEKFDRRKRPSQHSKGV